MAEEQQGGGAAESKLGQLYVELGAKGLGGLVKGLNGLSAQFLLTKNAAQQAIKPIVNMSMNAANTVTGWDKLSAVTGLSLKELQQISRFTGLNNIDFSSFTGQLKNVQQRLLDIRTGMSNDVQGFALLGLDPHRFDPKKPMELLNAVQKKVETVDTVTAAAALRWLGLSEDLLYVWEQQNNNFDERLNLSDEELNNLKEQQSAWNSLKVTWQAAQQKFIANQTWINDLLQKTMNWLSGTHPILEKTIKKFSEWLDAPHPYFENLIKAYDWFISTDVEEKKSQWANWWREHKEMQANLKIDTIKAPVGMTDDNANEWKKAAKQRADSIRRQEQIKNIIKKPEGMSEIEFNKLLNLGDLKFQENLISGFEDYKKRKNIEKNLTLAEHATFGSTSSIGQYDFVGQNPYAFAQPKVEQTNYITVNGSNADEIVDKIPDEIIRAGELNGIYLQNKPVQ